MRTIACILLACGALSGCGGAADQGDFEADALSAPAVPLGFNWGNAAKVFVDHWDQKSVTAKDPTRPFRVAQKNRVTLMRVFLGTDDVIARWRADPAGTFADVKRLLDGARARGVALVISARLDQATIEALAGRSYADWPEAQAAMVTEGSEAWDGYDAFLRALIGRFGAHPAAYSWEATNEPEWMLGTDAGAVSLDDLAWWLNRFQQTMHDAGARRVNLGGATLEAMSDDQLLLATEHTDLFDAHFYPDYDQSGAPIGSNAAALFTAFEQHIARVRDLSGRDRPAMVGEFGTLPAGWFTAIAKGCKARGWSALAWEFDGWDQFWFDDAHHADVLALLGSLNRVR